MIFRIFLFISLVFIQDNWIVFKSEQSHFSVLVPGEMKHKAETFLTDIGSVDFNSYIYKGDATDQNAVFIVLHYKYPMDITAEENDALADSLLLTTVEESLNKLEGSLDYQRNVEFGFYPGILYRIKYNNGNAILKSKSLIIKDDFYSLQIYTTIEKSLNYEMDKFLDSFRILE